jgi:hypothetical protein
VITSAVQDRVAPGNRVTLIARLVPTPGIHIYAAGSEGYGYRRVVLTVDAPAFGATYPPRYPAATLVRSAGEDEVVPVYAGPVDIRANILLGSRPEMKDALAAGALRVTGRIALQVCDERECYPPQEGAVAWDLELETPDMQRVPEALRREVRAKGR